MKKFYYLIAMAIMAFTFTSCEDVPAPFGQPVHISGDTEDDPSGGDDSGLAVNEDFKAAGKLTWTVTNVVAPDGIDVWQYDSRYGLKATAYAGGANNAAESWLICPEPYNFSNVSGAKMTIKHAANYFSDGAEKECKVLASTDYSKSVADATWTEIKIDTWPTSWDFVEGTGDMSAFDGKDKVYIAFKYTSTATKSGTWEIESLKVEGGGSSSGGGGSDTPAASGDGLTPATAFNAAAANAEAAKLADKAVSEKQYYIKGKIAKIATDGNYGEGKYPKTANYYISEDGNDANTFYIYASKYLGNVDYTEGTVLKVGDEVIVYGNLTNYNGTYETAQNKNYLYSLNGTTADGGESGGGNDNPTAKGDGLTPSTAFNAAAANAEAAKLANKATSEKQYYIKGKVAKIATDGNYGEGKYPKTANYYISEDGKDENTFYIYASKYLGNVDYTEGTVLKVGDEVIVYGNLTNYNGTYETAQNKNYLYSLNGTTADGGGSGSDTPSGTVGLDVTFDAGKATFTIEDKSIGDGITYVWSEDTTNKYMKASAYKGGAIAAESWLISPKFSLKTLTAPVLTFNNACNQVKTGVITDHIHVMVSTDGTNWTEASIANMPSGTNWTFVDSTVDMKAYAGKENVQIAFKYISTTSIAPTWEIKSVSVK